MKKLALFATVSLLFFALAPPVVAEEAGEGPPTVEELLRKPVTLRCDAPLADVVARIRQLVRGNLDVPPEVDPDAVVHLDVEELPLENLLWLLLDLLDLPEFGLAVDENILRIVRRDDPRGRLLPYDPYASSERVRKTRRALERREVTVNFEETPFLDAIFFLEDISDLDFVVSGEARGLIASEGLTTSVRLRQVRFEKLLGILLQAHPDLAIFIKHGVLYVTTVEEKERLRRQMAEDLRRRGAERVARWLEGADFEALAGKVERVLAEKGLEARCTVEKGGLLEVGDDDGRRAVARTFRVHLRAPLYQEITVSMKGVPVDEAVGTVVGDALHFVFPEGEGEQGRVTCKLRNVCRKTALEVIAMSSGYVVRYVSREGHEEPWRLERSYLFPDGAYSCEDFRPERLARYERACAAAYRERLGELSLGEDAEAEDFYEEACWRAVLDPENDPGDLFLARILREVESDVLDPIVVIEPAD